MSAALVILFGYRLFCRCHLRVASRSPSLGLFVAQNLLNGSGTWGSGSCFHNLLQLSLLNSGLCNLCWQWPSERHLKVRKMQAQFASQFVVKPVQTSSNINCIIIIVI